MRAFVILIGLVAAILAGGRLVDAATSGPVTGGSCGGLPATPIGETMDCDPASGAVDYEGPSDELGDVRLEPCDDPAPMVDEFEGVGGGTLTCP